MLKLPKLALPDPFLDEHDFLSELYGFDSLDVLTYSVSRISLPITRCIYVEGVPPQRAKSLRVSGTHAKLWIGYTDTTPVAYVGSANATSMTLNEIMYRATPKMSVLLADYFNDLWIANQPK
jgi:hypothetical protein